MGVSKADQQRHVWYDIGMDRIPLLMREALGCSLVHSTYSRLVLDANRWPGDPNLIPEQSDDVPIPANQDLDWQEKGRACKPFMCAITRPYPKCVIQLRPLMCRRLLGRQSTYPSIL